MHIALYKIEFQYLPSFSDSCENPIVKRIFTNFQNDLIHAWTMKEPKILQNSTSKIWLTMSTHH